jgi:hypothetical protein
VAEHHAGLCEEATMEAIVAAVLARVAAVLAEALIDWVILLIVG